MMVSCCCCVLSNNKAKCVVWRAHTHIHTHAHVVVVGVFWIVVRKTVHKRVCVKTIDGGVVVVYGEVCGGERVNVDAVFVVQQYPIPSAAS